MRIALVANSGSGSGDAAAAERLLSGSGADVTSFEPGDAAAAAGAGADRVVVAGGDGSIGVAAAAAARASVPLAVVPVGTANDFAAALGLPDEIEAAVELAVAGEVTQMLELGRLGDRPFVNVASIGLPPVAAMKASGLKAALGPLAYAVGAVRAGLTADPVECSVTCGSEVVHSGAVWQVTVACTGAFGGGAEIDADPADGALDAVVIPASSRAALAWRAYGLRSGRIDRQRDVDARRCPVVRIEAPPETAVNIDGELAELGAGEFTVERHGFDLVVPG